MEELPNGGQHAAAAIAMALMIGFLLIGMWDVYVKIYASHWPTVSSVIGDWFRKEPMLRFLWWLLVYHLTVQ